MIESPEDFRKFPNGSIFARADGSLWKIRKKMYDLLFTPVGGGRKPMSPEGFLQLGPARFVSYPADYEESQ